MRFDSKSEVGVGSYLSVCSGASNCKLVELDGRSDGSDAFLDKLSLSVINLDG